MPYSITLKQWESKSALLSHLEAARVTSLIIGLDKEAPREFYSFSLSTETQLLEIAVMSSGLGTKPIIILLNKNEDALLAHDTWLTGISLNTIQVTFNKRLNGVFFEFIPINSDNEAVTLHELGIIRIDSNGLEKWHVDTDVIENFEIDEHGKIHLRVINQYREVIVELESGKTFTQ